MSRSSRIRIMKLVFLSLLAAAGLLAVELRTPGIAPVTAAGGPPYTHCPIYPCGGGPPPMCIQRACDEPPVE